MKRVTVDMAAQATGLFDVHRFRQHTKKERESAWHAFRALGVGGSDMSTILGLNPYSTPYDLWLEKTNRQQPEDISARAVHECDEFTYSYGLNEDLRHVPCAKPGKLTHVYMIANFKDGGHYFQVMNADEIEAAAKRSPSYGKAVSPWKSDYEAMAKKTVIRRAFPYLPVSVEARDAAASDDQTPDYSDVFRPLPTVTADDSPVDASVDEPEEPEQSQPEAQPEVSPVEAKRAEAIARFQRLGVTDEQEALQTVAKITGMASESFADLSEAELDKVLGELKASVKEGK